MLCRRRRRTILMGHISNCTQNRNRRMPNGTCGVVRGRKTKVGRKLLRFPPTRIKRIGKRIRDASRYAYKLFVSFVAVWAYPTISFYWIIFFSVAIIARIAESTIFSTLFFGFPWCSIPAFTFAGSTFFLADLNITFYKLYVTIWANLFHLLEGLCHHRF